MLKRYLQMFADLRTDEGRDRGKLGRRPAALLARKIEMGRGQAFVFDQMYRENLDDSRQSHRNFHTRPDKGLI